MNAACAKVEQFCQSTTLSPEVREDSINKVLSRYQRDVKELINPKEISSNDRISSPTATGGNGSHGRTSRPVKKSPDLLSHESGIQLAILPSGDRSRFDFSQSLRFWAQGQGVQTSTSLFTSYFRSQYESQLKVGNGQALWSLTHSNRPNCACTFYQNIRFEESDLVGEPIVTAILSVKIHFYQLANQSYQPLQFEVRGAGGGTAMALESLAEALPTKLTQLDIPITTCR